MSRDGGPCRERVGVRGGRGIDKGFMSGSETKAVHVFTGGATGVGKEGITFGGM